MELKHLQLNAVKAEFIRSGGSDEFEDGLRHVRTTPFTALVQVINGAYEIEIGGETNIIRKGEAFLVGADRKTVITHHHAKQGGRSYMESHWVHFHFSLYETIDLTSLFDMPLKISAEYEAEVASLIYSVASANRDQSNNVFQCEIKILRAAYAVLEFVCQISPLRSYALDELRMLDRFKPVFNYVKNHFTEHITPEQLAKIANLSLSRFHHLFKEVMRCSPLDFVREKRIEKAHFLLLSTDMRISEIADAVGFTNQFHFSREFKKRTATTPTVFRLEYSR